jgi:hypothetical protein
MIQEIRLAKIATQRNAEGEEVRVDVQAQCERQGVTGVTSNLE